MTFKGLSMKKLQQEGVVTTLFWNIAAGWEQTFCFMADNHHDSIYCNRDLEVEHFEEAKRRKARVFIFGDFFDAMQGRYDPRRTYSEVRPEYQGLNNYYDVILKDAAKFLAPYAKNIDIISDGNHETAVLQNANTNLPDRLVGMLNDKCKSTVHHGGLGGWVRIMFNRGDAGQPTGTRQSIYLKYFHGAGGDAPVTRGAIQTARQAVYLPDAHIVVNGHNHNNYIIPISRERIGNKGKIFFDLQYHVRVPGYKQAYGDGSQGWEVGRGGPPKPIGCVWVHLKLIQDTIKIKCISDVVGPDPVELPQTDGGDIHFDPWPDDPEGE